MTAALVLRDALLPDGRSADLRLAEGRIAAIEPAGGPPAPGENAIALGGQLLLPGFVDGHIHLDKTFAGLPWRPHVAGGGVPARVAAEKAALAGLTVPIAERATALVRQAAAFGTTRMRSHVDIDTGVGLAGLEALLDVRARCADLMDIQLVAFPQSGVLAGPGTADLLDRAVAAGAEAVGGLDPAGFDGDIEGQLEVVFGIAERRGAWVDIHLHDPGEMGAFELRRIAARTRALGLQGRVAVSHAYALGAVDDATFGATADALAAAGVAIMTNGPGPDPIPPVKRLRAAGVTVFAGSDNIRDSWSPYGSGDMLERARLIGYRNGLATDDELALALALATDAAAGVLGVDGYGIAVGARADLVAVSASCVAEAVATFPPRSLVIRAGRVVARGGATVA
ncbi:MAG: amidohydrolase [Alphaproteobacteria bacterium]